MIFLKNFKKRINPSISVAKPGVRSKTPDTNINKPSPIALMILFGSFILDNLNLLRALIPSLLIKILPIMAVKTTKRIVCKDPMISPTLINKNISISGTEIKIIKKNNIFSSFFKLYKNIEIYLYLEVLDCLNINLIDK